MTPIDWDLVLDGSIYELNAQAYRTTVPSLRAQAHYHAEKRGLRIISRRVKGTNLLQLQAVAGVVSDSPALVRVELPPPGSVPVVQRPDPTSAPVAYDDPDDYSRTCTCSQYPKCQPLCFNYMNEQERAAYYAMSPAEHDAHRAAAQSEPPAFGSNGHGHAASAVAPAVPDC